MCKSTLGHHHLMQHYTVKETSNPHCQFSTKQGSDVAHAYSLYIACDREREELVGKMKRLVAGFDEEEEERRLALILDLACKKGSIERCVEKVWTARFR